MREACESACRQAFAAAATSPSESQQRVSQALRKGLGLRVQDEYQCPKSGYSIDMLVSDAHARPSGTSASTCTTGGVGSWAVEMDGEAHARTRSHLNSPSHSFTFILTLLRLHNSLARLDRAVALPGMRVAHGRHAAEASTPAAVGVRARGRAVLGVGPGPRGRGSRG